MSAPLDDAEIAALLAPVAGAPAIVLAVSGGADSLALLDVVDRWRRATGRPAVTVLTVDHALSAGSDAVARAVLEIAAQRGLPARLLRWDGPKPEGDIEAAARDARYALLTAAARTAGATHILTAHHREDQAETFLMRLSRGSGVFGLAAMRPMVERDGCMLFRPFLSVPRARLEATVQAAGLLAHRDPMNDDPRFLRVRMRKLLPGLAEIGVTPALLAAAADARRAEAEAIEREVDRLIATHVRIDAFAVATLPAGSLLDAAPAVRFRLLVRLLLATGGGHYPPRAARAAALLAALATGSVRRTLAGATVERRGDRIWIHRETGRDGLPDMPLTPGHAVWDRRFAVSVAEDAPAGLRLAALGRLRPPALPPVAGLPAAARAALPAVFRGATPVAVPALGWGAAPGVTLTACVAGRLAQLSIVSHMGDRGADPMPDTVHRAAISA